MTDLDKLIAAVEAGDRGFSSYLPVAYEKMWAQFYLAFDGSLDAALRLHEALLPGWAWFIECTNAAEIWPQGGLTTATRAYSDEGTPARAWLLAILRALSHNGRGE